ncbi:Small subunit (SSU) processome component, partial [Coemansia sp. RSA 2704]
SRLHAWPGHASPVHTLLWAADEAALVSAAEGDRHVHVWDASPDAAARPRAVLATDSDVMHVDVSPRGSVLAVGADGVLHAWHQVAVAQRSANGPRRGDIGYTADGRVRFASTADASRTLPVLLARFSRVAGDEGHVLVVRGSALKPLFEPLSLAGADGQFAPELVLSREPQDNLLLSAGQTAAEKQVAAQLHAYSEQGATVTDPLAEGVRASRAAADDAAGAALPSLADRIKQLSVAGSDQSGAPALAAGLKLTAGTLVRVLVQSLHTSDHEMLETVLSNNARANVVRDTVLGLPTAYVLLFLQQLFERFHATPARAAQLLPWIRSTLALHSAYLTSIPGLIPQLSGFYQAIESRLRTHQRLLRLSGRLELANTQIRARSQLEKAHDRQLHDSHKNAPMQPLNTYREEDDDESDGPTRLSTEPPTPVWQAAQSTDDEASSDDDAQASDDEQWNEGSAASSDEEMAAEGSGSSSDDGSDDDSNEDSGSDSASDLDELE